MKKILTTFPLVLIIFCNCQSPNTYILHTDTSRHTIDTVPQTADTSHQAPDATRQPPDTTRLDSDTTGMHEYLSQTSKEEKEGFPKDAAIIITPSRLVERSVWWEQFADRHPNFEYIREAREQYSSYLGILLTGMDNTPLTDNGKLTSFYEDAYTF
ncbi:MAG TPA: hypothetical protein VI233_03550, partial [Puia sp.]